MTVHSRLIKDKDGKSRKLQGHDEAGKLWLTRLLELVEKLDKDKKLVVPFADVDDEIVKARKESKQTLAKLSKVRVTPTKRDGNS